MKVLQVIPYFFVDWAGGNPQVEQVHQPSKALVKRGHEVTLYTTDAFNKKSKSKYQHGSFQTVVDGIKVREFKSWRNLPGINIIVSPAMIRAVAQDIRNFDIVHLHEYRTFQNMIVHHFATKYRIPYVVQAHGSVATFFQKGIAKKVFDNLIGYKILNDAALLLASTEAEAAQYKAMGISERKIKIVPNGVDLSQFNILPAKGEFRKTYGLTESNKVILFLGRIHKVKGLDLLLKAFAQLTDKLNNITLIIAGPDYGDLPAMKRLAESLRIEEKTIFTGPLSVDDKLRAFIDADIYVLPSVYETFPTTALEACACGTPIIITEACGIADVINGKAGIAVPRDVECMKNAILELLSDDGKRREFGENGRRLVREQYNWTKVAEQIENVYRGILAHA